VCDKVVLNNQAEIYSNRFARLMTIIHMDRAQALDFPCKRTDRTYKGGIVYYSVPSKAPFVVQLLNSQLDVNVERAGLTVTEHYKIRTTFHLAVTENH
jgi:hypothetical protein